MTTNKPEPVPERAPKYKVGQKVRTRSGNVWTIEQPGQWNKFWRDVDYRCAKYSDLGTPLGHTSLLESEVTLCQDET